MAGILTKNNGKFPYTLDEILDTIREFQVGEQGETGQSICAEIYTWFLPSVIGCNRWRNNCTEIRLNDLATKTDEALIFFNLDNSYDAWISGWKIDDIERKGLDRGEMKLEDTKYTQGRGREARTCGGWSDSGKKVE